jgi:branched-chain amino acid transport system substrate-binding protein
VQAQASRAKVIGMANAGADTINTVKQAAEFGITRRGVKLAALLMFLPDVHALGLQTAQSLIKEPGHAHHFAQGLAAPFQPGVESFG